MRGVFPFDRQRWLKKHIWAPEMMEILLMPVNVSERDPQPRQTAIHTDPPKISKASSLQKRVSKSEFHKR